MSPAPACCWRRCRRRADPFDLGRDLSFLQRVPRPPPAELFLRRALDN